MENTHISEIKATIIPCDNGFKAKIYVKGISNGAEICKVADHFVPLRSPKATKDFTQTEALMIMLADALEFEPTDVLNIEMD